VADYVLAPFEAHEDADAILARAGDQSESMLAAARVDAEARTRQAEQEIASLHDEAEARMRSLQADIAAVSDERRTLLDDIRRITARLEAVVAEAEQVESEMPPEAARPGGTD
jgi:chromosome segregation ATPase